MSCKNIRKQFSEYLDEALSPERRAALEEHLAACPHCRQELAKWRQVVQAVRALPERSVGESFTRNVMVAVSEQKKARPRRRRLISMWPGLAAAAVLALVASVTLVVYPRRREPGEPTRTAELRREADSLEHADEIRAREPIREAGRAGALPAAKPPTGDMLLKEELAGRPASRSYAMRIPAGPEEADRSRGTVNRLVFTQVVPANLPERRRPTQTPQVLVLEGDRPLELARQVIEVANENGLPATLAFNWSKEDGPTEIEVDAFVPAGLYSNVMGQLAALTGRALKLTAGEPLRRARDQRREITVDLLSAKSLGAALADKEAERTKDAMGGGAKPDATEDEFREADASGEEQALYVRIRIRRIRPAESPSPATSAGSTADVP